MRVLFFAAVLLASGPAFAQAPASPAPTRAVLAEGTAAPAGRLIVDGANWRCEGSSCTASGGTNQPATRACRRVKAKLGPLTEFAWRGELLSAEQLATCNA